MRSWDAIRLWKKSWVFVASLHCIWNVTEIMEKTDDEYDYSTTTAASKLAKTHITHEMILFEMCIFQIPSDFTFFSYPAWTIQGITTSFDKIFVKARIFRKSFFIKYLLGHPVIYPENIAWQTFSKKFTKVMIFSRYSLNGQVKAMPVPYIPSDTRVLSTASSSNQILDIGRPDSRYSNRSRDRRSRSRSRHRSRSKHRRANVQSSSSGQSGSTQFSSSNSTGRLVTNGNPRLL